MTKLCSASHYAGDSDFPTFAKCYEKIEGTGKTGFHLLATSQIMLIVSRLTQKLLQSL